MLSTEPDPDDNMELTRDVDQQDEDEEPDPDSQAEWRKLIEALSKKKSKDSEQAVKIAAQCEKLLSETARNVERDTRNALASGDARLAKMNLSDTSVPHVAAFEELVKVSDAQLAETEAQMAAFDELLEGIMPEHNPFFAEARNTIEQRPQLARKAHKKIRKALEHELEATAELAQASKVLPAGSGLKSLREVQRKLLEQLMGAEAMGIVEHDLSLWDPKVCRAFVAGVCPHDLFTNTKMDLGTCPKTHSAKLRNEYQAMLKKAEDENDQAKILELNRMKVDYEQTIYAFIDECDRRIRAAHRRLEKTPEENNRATNLMREIGEIEGAYQAAMTEVERLGSEGKVEESMAELQKAEALKTEKEDKERELQQLTETSGASGHQKLRVCEICGAYLSVLDSDRRLADHFGGKMHLGYHQLRTYIDEWRARGPLPVGDAPRPAGGPSSGPTSFGGGGNVPNGPPSHHMPPPASYNGPPPPTGPSSSASYRPRDGPTVPQGPPAPGFVPAGGSNGSDRDRDRRRDDRDRDGPSSSSRRHDDDARRSSSRYDDDRRSSRYEDDRRSAARYDDRDRASATNGYNPSSSRSSRRDDDRRRRYDDEDDAHRSSRRSYDDEGASGDSKRRRTDDA
ncbi:splicing factor [Microbotryomycetes sp. JL201]|nr:splicing factor [Microbotryomycetes sp. JL201]